MDMSTGVEINFHQQKEVSLFLESSECGQREVFGEIAVFGALALRILCNLGRCEYADLLANILVNASDNFGELCEPGPGPAGVEIITHPGVPGRKRFIASVRWTDEGFSTNVKSSGFGWLNVGYGAYAPVAVVTFLRFLVRKRGMDMGQLHDIKFRLHIAGVCRDIANLHFNTGISPFANHHQLVLNMLPEVISTYL